MTVLYSVLFKANLNQIYIGFSPSKYMHYADLTSFSFDPVLMDDAQCNETNEKSVFRFLFFELSWKFIENWGDDITKMTKKSEKSKLEKSEIWYLFGFSRFRIFLLDSKTFDKKKIWSKKFEHFLILFCLIWWGTAPPTKKHPGSENFF